MQHHHQHERPQISEADYALYAETYAIVERYMDSRKSFARCTFGKKFRRLVRKAAVVKAKSPDSWISSAPSHAQVLAAKVLSTPFEHERATRDLFENTPYSYYLEPLPRYCPAECGCCLPQQAPLPSTLSAPSTALAPQPAADAVPPDVMAGAIARLQKSNKARLADICAQLQFLLAQARWLVVHLALQEGEVRRHENEQGREDDKDEKDEKDEKEVVVGSPFKFYLS